MVKAAVIGGTGYAGVELVRILLGHPHAELTMITSRQYAGRPFSDIYPAMAEIVNLTCLAFSEEAVSEAADVIFAALPHKASMGIVAGLIDRGKRVIDLSADFRFKDPALYEAWYEPHQAKDLLKTLATHFCEVNEGFKAYKVAEHRHNPEMDEVLSLFAGRTIHMTFTPHLVPMTRGMLTTIYVGLKEDVSTQDVASYLDSFYAGKPFVRICPRGRFPNTMYVRGTNYCDIGFQVAERTKRLVLISAIDNLVKGASGQAVQNMNIMLGLPETAGLDQIPFPL